MQYNNSIYEPKYRTAFFQKGEVKEQLIKAKMRRPDEFNPKNVENYVNPQLSLEDRLKEKLKSGKKLNSSEKIQYEFIQKKIKEALELDLNRIEILKENSSGELPETEEGKVLLLFHHLNKYIESNNDTLVCHIFLKIQNEGYYISPENKVKYKSILDKMEEIVNKNDLIKLQFTKLFDSMKPLNEKGFKRFDKWQLDVIEAIKKNISLFINASTSAGKSILAAFGLLQGRGLFLVPNEALAWEIASYISGFLNKDVPIITDTFNSMCPDSCICVDKNSSHLDLSCAKCSISTRDKTIKYLNSADAIVATPDAILNFLPFMNIDFKWVIMDEVHMIGKIEGSSMEHIAKVLNNINFLGLSATIGNTDEITSYFKNLNPKRNIQNIICNTRFLNLQRYFFDQETKIFKIINPLALVNINDFEDKSILNKNITATPKDTWLLYQKLIDNFSDLDKMNHTKYFNLRESIHLTKANAYFVDLIQYMVNKFHSGDKDKIIEIINSFKNFQVPTTSINLVELAFKLKESEEVPAIIFSKNTLACIKKFIDFGTQVEAMEDKEFPDTYNTRISDSIKADKIRNKIESLSKAQESKAKQANKNREKSKIIRKKESSNKSKNEDDDYEKEDDEENNPIDLLYDELATLDTADPYEPISKYIFNCTQTFTKEQILEIVNDLKVWFPCEKNNKPHLMIRLLWRGLGIYAKGLPEPYLRLVQKLTREEKISILFSDISLAFGVSMPIVSCVIYNDPYVVDDLDSMLFHQMAGRAGRRGYTKKGNIIFAGYSWERIQELSISSIPNIIGINSINYSGLHAHMISQNQKNKLNWENIYDNYLSSNTDNLSLSELKLNYETKWKFALSKDINHCWMMWTLRNSGLYQPIIISYLLPIIIKKYNNQDYTSTLVQNEVFYFLANFLDSLVCDKDQDKDKDIPKILDELNELNIPLPTTRECSNNVWLSFRMNNIITSNAPTDIECNEIRKRLLDLSQKFIGIQLYFYHSNMNELTKIFGKIIKRISNIYHNNSYLIKPIINQLEYQSIVNYDNLLPPSFAYYYDESIGGTKKTMKTVALNDNDDY